MNHRLLCRFALVFVAISAGCAARRPAAHAVIGTQGFLSGRGVDAADGDCFGGRECAPPVGWVAEPLKTSDRHTHQVWLSPTGKTAYGVVHFTLPLPVGVNLVHWQFLREMQKHEGDAIEISRQSDPALPGIRFIVDSGRYRMRSNLIVQGFEGWAIYAASLRGEEPVPAEMESGERARENTIVGLPERPASAERE